MKIPELTTERLTLRGHRTDDFPDCLAMWSDPQVTEHITGRALSGEEVWAKLLRYVGHWTLLGFGYWAVIESSSGRFVGEVGLAYTQREGLPELAGTPEVGWAIGPPFFGRGLATEAVRAAVEWHDAHFAAERTACLIAPENTASIRVAEKCGYSAFAETTYKGDPTILFQRLRAG